MLRAGMDRPQIRSQRQTEGRYTFGVAISLRCWKDILVFELCISISGIFRLKCLDRVSGSKAVVPLDRAAGLFSVYVTMSLYTEVD